MGYRISWIGFEGLDRTECLKLVVMSDTGKPDETNEAPFSVATLPTGWTILFSNDFDYASDEKLAEYSRKSRVACCRIEETVMFCSAAAFENGLPIWQVSHDADQGLMNLETYGELPKEFADIQGRQFSEQEADGGAEADTDYIFDIPVELAAALTGYRHDRGRFEWGEAEFTEVEPATASNRS